MTPVESHILQKVLRTIELERGYPVIPVFRDSGLQEFPAILVHRVIPGQMAAQVQLAPLGIPVRDNPAGLVIRVLMEPVHQVALVIPVNPVNPATAVLERKVFQEPVDRVDIQAGPVTRESPAIVVAQDIRGSGLQE